MEPTNPNNLNTGPNNPPTAHKPGRPSRKVWIIPGILLLLIAIIGAVVWGSKGATPPSNQTQDAYYDRPGFERTNLTTGIGDPAPLTSKTTASPIAYKGASVIQACNLLTPENIRQLGLHLQPNSLANIDRTYFDGQGQGELHMRPTSLATLEDANSCSYPIYKPKGRVSIDTYQPAYNAPSAFDYEIKRRFKDAGTIEGFKQYLNEEEGRKTYLLRNGDSGVQIYIRDIQDPQTIQKIVTVIAGNFKRLLAAPDGPIQFAYNSPAFPKSSLNGCNVTRASDIQTLFNANAKPLVEERLASATGVIKFLSQKDDNAYSYINHACTRQAAGEAFGPRRSLTIESSSFLTVDAAKKKVASDKQFDAKITAVPTQIGDETYFSYTTGQNPEMTIRKGRFVINLGLYDQSKPQLSDGQMIQSLTPVAQAIVGRIKDF